MAVTPPEDQHRRLNQAANALVSALRTIPWKRALVAFTVQADRVQLFKLRVEPADPVALSRFDASGLAAVGDVLTSYWRRAGPEPWSRGTLCVFRVEKGVDGEKEDGIKSRAEFDPKDWPF